ncbi:uncharacterized protein LAESUDRAFT_654509 [Laetiporus sulphureus 93-53]|uniref:F-box domain-containing protein n=1 Tax=Laetiporus sulphureus 93-53 TaxID=1314785 RepID=A0A165DZ25_9APHY|nr:uncharacterized protein LAESUDRAFT_654509 [Laetiporus sulphureus 93-53]KZT05927.1 hypothetical protein LAESUDRAFT_654509 [Laetiporus sulphureus 93-53]
MATAERLPIELLLHIFELAVENESLFDHALPTSMVESSWVKSETYHGCRWWLKSPQESLDAMQKMSYYTAKAIIATCKAWRSLGSEVLFRFLHFTNPTCLLQVCSIMDRDHTLGWRTKRLQISRYYASYGATMDEMQNSLISIIQHCPNLEIFVATWPIPSALTAVIDALCTFCSNALRTIHLHIPNTSVAKAILMLEFLPNLSSLHLEVDGPPVESSELGSASNLTLVLPALRQLSLKGLFQDFLEQATGWDLPALETVSLDFLGHREDLPDIMEFLASHGPKLTYLDINCIPPLDVATILDLCPLLKTFAFNFDWRLESAEGENFGVGTLVHRPHQNIATIGCHQLLHAFGVGEAAKYTHVDPFATYIIRRRNDMNFATLRKKDFPRLQRVRVLSRTLLRDLESANGPDGMSFKRWEQWWEQCTSQGIRLEDCTGNLLGNLPEVEEYEDEEEVEERKMEPFRELLQQCRQMSTTQ